MLKLNSRHLKTGEELSPPELRELIELGIALKNDRKSRKNQPTLAGKHLGLIFDKPSLRTRFSFTVAMNELGGHSNESMSTTRKPEDPKDIVRALSGYCHGLVVRTHKDIVIEKMAYYSKIPIINGLSELYHPCQILADLMTLQEVYGNLHDVTLSYVGDGNNILHSLLLMSPLVGVHVRFSCPIDFQPHPQILNQAKARSFKYGTEMTSCPSAQEAVQTAHAVYTDVWTSMGFENERQIRNGSFAGYQVNEELMTYAAPNAVVMHCLPMEKGKEISESLAESPSSVIFQQSENRLHMQKALLIGLLGDP